GSASPPTRWARAPYTPVEHRLTFDPIDRKPSFNLALSPTRSERGMEAGMLNIETATSPRPDAMSAGVVHDLGNLIQIASSAMNILARNPRVYASELEPVIAGARVSLDRAGALVRQTMGVMHARRATTGPADVAACLA